MKSKIQNTCTTVLLTDKLTENRNYKNTIVSKMPQITHGYTNKDIVLQWSEFTIY